MTMMDDGDGSDDDGDDDGSDDGGGGSNEGFFLIKQFSHPPPPRPNLPLCATVYPSLQWNASKCRPLPSGTWSGHLLIMLFCSFKLEIMKGNGLL